MLACRNRVTVAKRSDAVLAKDRNQERDLLDQLQRIQQQVRGSVRPRMGQLEEQLPCALSVNRSSASGGRKRYRRRRSNLPLACADTPTFGRTSPLT
jgi:hypothetical protein